MFKPIHKTIRNPSGNRGGTFNWNKVIGHNFTDDGEVAYPPKGFFTFETKHQEYSADDDIILAFPKIDIQLDGVGELEVGKVHITGPNDTNFHTAVGVNNLVPFKNFIESISHIAPVAGELGAIIPFTDHFAAQYFKYRVTSFDLDVEFTPHCHETTVVTGTAEFRCGLLLIDSEVAISTGASALSKTKAELELLISARWKAGTLKTVPIAVGHGLNRSGTMSMSANIINQFMDKESSRLAANNLPVAATLSAGSPYDVTDMRNYQGDLLVSQAAMGSDSVATPALPNIRLWVLPFAILTKPWQAGFTSSGDRDVQILCNMKLRQHVQLTNPKVYTYETKD